MRTVFQPLNLRMEEALVANSHLLIGDAVPTAFRKLIAHTEAYKAVIASWRDEDLASCTAPAPQQAGGPPCLHLRQVRNTAPLNYPALVVGCVTEDYANLKRRQQELQGGFLSAFFTRGVAPSPACG